MTLDEAIKHCEEKEREQALNGCFACAEEHKQLAEWLKDYKRLLEERPQGEWIDYDNTFYKCPECGYLLLKDCPYCQNKVILPFGKGATHEDRADYSI